MFKVGPGEFMCEHCHRAEYIAEEDPNIDINLAKSSELPEPETMDNVEPLISHHHVDATDPYSKKKKGILLKDGMAELARRGTLRVTSYRDSSEGVEGAD